MRRSGGRAGSQSGQETCFSTGAEIPRRWEADPSLRFGMATNAIREKRAPSAIIFRGGEVAGDFAAGARVRAARVREVHAVVAVAPTVCGCRLRRRIPAESSVMTKPTGKGSMKVIAELISGLL
jgi:hypothetical protein